MSKHHQSSIREEFVDVLVLRHVLLFLFVRHVKHLNKYIQIEYSTRISINVHLLKFSCSSMPRSIRIVSISRTNRLNAA
jgi:hypothetical protein